MRHGTICDESGEYPDWVASVAWAVALLTLAAVTMGLDWLLTIPFIRFMFSLMIGAAFFMVTLGVVSDFIGTWVLERRRARAEGDEVQS